MRSFKAGPRSLVTVPTSLALREIEIWSFNLRTEFCDEVDGPDGWSKRKGDVAEFIKTRKPALVCCQEATPYMIKFLGDYLGSQYGWRASPRVPGYFDEGAGFLWDVNRLKLLDYAVQWLAPPGVPNGKPGWDAMYPRTFETCLFSILGAAAAGPEPMLRAYSTHFDHHGVEARKESGKMLAANVLKFAKEHPSCAHVLCGDFNSCKDAPQYASLTSPDQTGRPPMLDAIRVTGIAQGCTKATQPAAGNTIHRWQGVNFSAAMGDGSVDLSNTDVAFDSRHIDWILWRDGTPASGVAGTALRPLRHTIIVDRLRNGRYPSDHFPISVIFAVEDIHLPRSKL